MTEPGPRVRQVLALLDARRPTLGDGRLVCVDGPAGSGKTTLATAVAAATGAHVVHMDDLYEGWGGLDLVDVQLGSLLAPLSIGRPGRYRRYDWDAGRFAETVEVAPAPLLVLEGVGSGSASFADLATVLVWVEVGRRQRLERGLARDGEAARDHWLVWQDDEDRHHALHDTRARADLLVDGAVPLA